MINSRSTTNLIIDAILFTGFIILFFTDFTGVALHQWLGVAGGALVIYHLLEHWDWVAGVSKRFFKRTNRKSHLYYLVDLILLLGFAIILLSGMVISTWLDLALDNMAAWIDLHITASILTMLVVVYKIAIHGRWIVATAHRMVESPAVVETSRSASHLVPALTTNSVNIERRNFLKLMGVVGAAAAISIINLAIPHEDSFAERTNATSASTITPQDTTSSISTPQETAPSISTPQISNQSANCATRCRKGNSCSYPGKCHDYRDINNNGRCDQGECT